jgi:hypothetical protein
MSAEEEAPEYPVISIKVPEKEKKGTLDWSDDGHQTKLYSEDGGEWSGRGHFGDPLARGEGSGAIHGVTRPGAWPLWGGSKELLDTSLKISESSTGVCISILTKLLHLHCVLMLCALPS